jgi:xylan 1,4-beta-xylosidase
VIRARLSRALAGAVLALPVPLLGGDWPDPSLIRDGGGYTAVSTSGGWAPTFRLLSSDDLHNWRLEGAAFRRPPRWAQSALWAPELTRLNGGYAIFYSALPRQRRRLRHRGSSPRTRPWYCLGVATAPTPAGPYRDRGRPLRCGRFGSIDPFPVRDELGRLYLLWKEDGNEFRRPTPILSQRLSEDGRRLRGRPRELIRARDPWEGRVVEAPTVVRHGGYFYLFYSANLCCTEDCAYAVGVARSPTLRGRWERYPGNPILRDGNGWRCPGHTSLVQDATGSFKALFHAYRTGAGLLIGRQLLAENVSFGQDGWPRIGAGVPPEPEPDSAPRGFSDSFGGPFLDLAWEWPAERAPRIRVAGGLRLRAARRGGRRVDAGVLSRRMQSDRYVASAVADRRALRGHALAGLASYQSGSVAIGIAVGTRRLIVWQRRKGRYEVLAQTDAPASPLVHLRLTGHWRDMSFAFSTDGAAWTPIAGEVKTPVEETARFALTVGGKKRAVAQFTKAALSEQTP